MAHLMLYPNGMLLLAKIGRTFLKPSPVGHLIFEGSGVSADQRIELAKKRA